MESAESPKKTAFTGRKRKRSTRRSVLIADRAAGMFITLGGLGTIMAVFLVCVFLVWIVVPLFLPESMNLMRAVPVKAAPAGQKFVHLAPNEYLNLGWTLTSDAQLQLLRLDDGKSLATPQVFSEKRPSCWSLDAGDGNVAFGFEDGSMQMGRIRFRTSFIDEDEVTPEMQKLAVGDLLAHADGIVERTPEGQFRLQSLDVEFEEPVTVKAGSSISLIDQSVSNVKGAIVATFTADGELRVGQVTKKKNLLTGKVTTRLKEGSIQVDLPAGGRRPKYLRLTGLGDMAMLVWDDGRTLRYDTRNISSPVLAEEFDLLEEPKAKLTALEFLIGKTSLVAGDSLGRTRVWFATKPEDAQTPDGAVMVKAHELQTGTKAVAELAPSLRSRMLAVGFEDGLVRVFHVTSDQTLADEKLPREVGSPQALAFGPKDDAIVALGNEELAVLALHAPHPETTLSSIFRPVWYEGMNHPEHVWQSSSGEDAFEPKYGLTPLMFGTFKATFYSMLFGAPIALLAAIYSSEFLNKSTKAKIKPTIEIMASLPSVVLGFLAALVVAPIIEDVVPQVLTAFVTVPFSLLLGAYLWQLVPVKLAPRLRQFRIFAMAPPMVLGFFLAWKLGKPVENWLFAGDIQAWLDGQIGSGIGAWMFLFMPVSALLVALAVNMTITPLLRRNFGHLGRTQFALLDLLKFLFGAALVIAVAYAFSTIFTVLGWDPRGTFVGTFVQRNALVVGVIMGFAIIPIIYTISDDALSSVPESLRAGSLGSGATEWQTAIRIVIPTAMSGLFSALMIGLGRAVGETMIVLMAAGNTPVMDWNIFNGFRTLSANIAVELPEAAAGTTHFRMLYLAALSLFVLTFLVNTVAEIVRLRFRKRAFQL